MKNGRYIYDEENRDADKGEPRYVEKHFLDKFEKICSKNGVTTIWDACQRWPRLLSTTCLNDVPTCLFPEAYFEQHRRAISKQQAGDRALSHAILSRRFGIPENITATIIAFAQCRPKYQAFYSKKHAGDRALSIAILSKHFDIPENVAAKIIEFAQFQPMCQDWMTHLNPLDLTAFQRIC